jgi:7-carboxy-7-deazaguanine synthase
MLISEIFYSIQGEGELTGVPSVFVRTSGCNLRCRWCDTKYASWNPEGEQKSVAKIVDHVCGFPGAHVVLTGGEPMVAKDIHALALALKARGKHITIETAGTIPPEGIACDLASISPKLGNSTPFTGEIDETWRLKHDHLRFQPDVLEAWASCYSFQFKFVIQSNEDVGEMEDLISQIPIPIPAHKIQLMPEGTSVASLRDKTDFIVGLCKDRGYRFSNRLHVELFGNKRGT